MERGFALAFYAEGDSQNANHSFGATLQAIGSSVYTSFGDGGIGPVASSCVRKSFVQITCHAVSHLGIEGQSVDLTN